MIPIMLLQTNMTIVICTSFYYNQNYIEKYLCIQRDMKVNNCHGQCYLMKKLKDKQENEQKNFKVIFHEATVTLADIIELPSVITIPLDRLSFSDYKSEMNPSDFNKSIFRPPVLA